MKIVIDIPKEFERDYNVYRYKDFFGRVMADMNCLCGNYEKETAEMFIKSFDESVYLADHDKQIIADERERIIEELEEKKHKVYSTYSLSENNIDLGVTYGLEKAIEIVKGEKNERS